MFGFVAMQMTIHAQQNPVAAASQSNPKPQSAGTNSLVIAPGDLLDVQVFNTPELSGRHRVGQNGQIKLSQTPEFNVAGMTLLEAGAEIARQLRAADIMSDAQVTVLIEANSTGEITVLGEVARPGNYALPGSLSLSGALGAAGGITPRAGSTITITHRDDPRPLIIEMDAQNPAGKLPFAALRPDDVVLVSHVGRVFVVGDVGHPGEYDLNNGPPLRALQALALAQGLKNTSAPKKASIIRSIDPEHVETIPVDLARVAKNDAPDPILEPSDVLVVPGSGFKEFYIAVLPSLTGAAANAIALALAGR